MFENLTKLPRWALYVLVLTTLVLSLIILGRIWFPDMVDEGIFWKVLLSYIIVILSAGVIAKIGNLISKMDDTSN